MVGNTIGNFIDDLLLMGGPEKEFVFRDKYFFLETTYNKSNCSYEICIDEYDNTNPKKKSFVQSHRFPGKDFAECVSKFENAAIFDNMTIYQAEQEIEVLFG